MAKDYKNNDLAGSDGPDDPNELDLGTASVEPTSGKKVTESAGDSGFDLSDPDGLTPDGGGGDGPDPQMIKNYNSSKSNTSSVRGEDGLTPDGGGSGEPAMIKNYNSSKSNTSSVSDSVRGLDDVTGGGELEGGEASVTTDISVGGFTLMGGQGLTPDGGGGGGSGGGGSTSAAHEAAHVVQQRGGGGKGPGIVRKGVGKTLGLAKTMIMTAVLISVAGAGVDVYQTYNDAIAIDLEEHITDADFELSEDKSEISGSVGFDIPQMGTFEKSIIASVHITVLESNPTTDGDYEFEYTLGSGEHFYDFTLDDLDPVTVEKIEAGQPLDIEYSGTISVTYLGIEIPSVTMDIPLTTTIVETA